MNSPRTDRIFKILFMTALNPGPTQLKDISTALGVHPSMVSRMVADLVESGLLAKCAYRSVLPTPKLGTLGLLAGKNHPLSAIARQELRGVAEELNVSCEFASLSSLGMFHFYQVRRGTPPAEPMWRSDLAAVIFAAQKKSWEEVAEILKCAAPPAEQGSFARFQERFEKAGEARSLVNYHAGRFWQLTVPVTCGELGCALSFAGVTAADTEKIFFEASKAAARIRSAWGAVTENNA